MLGTSMATEKHKNPFRFLQRAALMSRQWEQELELELELKLGSTEAAGNRCGIVVVVLKLIAKQRACEPQRHIQITYASTTNAAEQRTRTANTDNLGKISKIRSERSTADQKAVGKVKGKQKRREREERSESKEKSTAANGTLLPSAGCV